jgi:phenylacetate-CoA ligase
METLARLPTLPKETLRARSGELLSQSRLPSRTKVFKSSGTTGTPTEIYFTPQFHNLNMAIAEARSLNWGGCTYRDRRVMFGARKVCRFEQDRPPFWRYSPAENMAYASIFHLSPQFLQHYMAFLRRFQPVVVMGYPSALHRLAGYALQSGDLPAAAKVVITTSETVTAEARKAVETAWRCRLMDRYGSVEACAFASQCEHSRYHVSPDYGIVEIVDDEGRTVPPGSMGKVVATGLHNTLQPLIRYELGDLARWAVEQECPCGRQMPVLEGIEGRFEDLCITPDGREMLRFDTVFKGVTTIREAQVVQERVDLFEIRIVPAPGFHSEDASRIQENMLLHVGQVEVRVILVEAIPRSESGKFRAVVCKLSRDEKDRIRSAALAR